MAAKKQNAKKVKAAPAKKKAATCGSVMQAAVQEAKRELDEDERKLMAELEREQKELDSKRKKEASGNPKRAHVSAAGKSAPGKGKSAPGKGKSAPVPKKAPTAVVVKPGTVEKIRAKPKPKLKPPIKPIPKRASLVADDMVLMIDPRVLEIEDGWNPRFDYGDMNDLVHSIGTRGVRQPIVCTLRTHSAAGVELRSPKYVVNSGHRRQMAAVKALEKGYDGCKKIPVLVRAYKGSDDRFADALILNDHKRMNPVEMCAALTRLRDAGRSVKEISELVGKRQTWVRITLALSGAGDKLTSALVNGEISVRDSTEIIKSADGDMELQDRAVLRRGFLKKKHKLSKRPIDDDSKIMQPALMRRHLSDLASAYSRFRRGRGPAKEYNEDWVELEELLIKLRKAKSTGRLVV